MWTPQEGKAVAIYPYNSNKEHRLELVTGDIIQIIQVTDEWVYGKNLSNSMVGICPKNRLDFNISELDMVDFEARCLLSNSELLHQLHERCDPSSMQSTFSETYADVISQFSHALDLAVLKRTPSQTEDLSQTLSTMRSSLKLPELNRNNSFAFRRSHDMTASDLIKDSGSGSSVIKFETTISLTLTLKVTLTESARICPRFYTVNGGRILLNAPADIFHVGSEKEVEHVIKINNLDKDIMRQLLLEVRVFSHRQFGEGGQYCHEYLGVAAEYFGTDSNPIFIKSDDKGAQDVRITRRPVTFPDSLTPAKFELDLSMPKDGFDPRTTLDDILSSQIEKYISTGIKIASELRYATLNEEAITPDGVGSIHALKEPQSLGPSFKANLLFLSLIHLRHKTSKKRTRVVVRLFDIEQNKLVSAFERMGDITGGDSFVTVVEKGSKEFDIDEMAAINLDNVNVKSTYIVVEVHRVSRSKGTDHVSSYGIIPIAQASNARAPYRQPENQLTRNKAILVTENDRSFDELSLKKPTGHTEKKGNCEVIPPSDYKKLITSFDYQENKTTVLKFKTELLSTVNTSIPAVRLALDSCITGKALPQDELKGLTNDQSLKRYFVAPILRAIANTITKIPAAINEFIEVIVFLDKTCQRTPIYRLFFDEFLNSFKEGETALSTLHNPIVDEINRDLNKSARTMGYLLHIATSSLKISGNKAKGAGSFAGSLRSIANKVLELFTELGKDNPSLKAPCGFIMQSYNMLCDLIYKTLEDRKEAAELVSQMIKLCNTAQLTFQYNARKSVVNISAMKNKSTRPMIYKTIIETLKTCNTHFQKECYPILVHLFFSTMQYAENSDSELVQLAPFVEEVMYMDLIGNIDLSESGMNNTLKIMQDFYKMMLNKSDEFYSHHIKLEKQKESLLLDIKATFWSNPIFVLLLLSQLGQSRIEEMFNTNKNGHALFWAILSMFSQILDHPETKDNYSLISIMPGTLSKLLAVMMNSESLRTHLSIIVEWTNEFYRKFLRAFSSMPKFDNEFLHHIYHIDINGIATTLADLIGKISEEQRFIPQVIVPFFHVFMSADDEASKKLVANAFAMVINADIKINNNDDLEMSSNAAMSALSSISNDAESHDLLQLLDLYERASQQTQGTKNFFDRLIMVTKSMNDLMTIENDAKHADQKVRAIVTIIESCLANNDLKLFLHFTSELYNFHKTNKNFLEAAETLRYAANQIQWTDTTNIQEGHGHEVQEPAFRRKLYCLITAMGLYKQTFFYERAIEVAQEIRTFYKDIAFDYVALSAHANQEKELYSLVGGDRVDLNAFYGVHYYGDKFPEDIRNKTFIYRRDSFTNAGKMMAQLQSFYPDARVDSKPPKPEELGSPDLYMIHVFNVVPFTKEDEEAQRAQEERKVNKGQRADFVAPELDIYTTPSELMMRRLTRQTKFISEMPERRRRQDKLGEFAEAFIVSYIYTVEHPLEYHESRAEVKEVSDKRELQPVECALRMLSQKTTELLQKTAGFYRQKLLTNQVDPRSLQGLTMLVKGIADAGVNGGITVYTDIFLGDSEFAQEKVNKDNAEELKTTIMDQVRVLKWAIRVHSGLITGDAYALHNQIEMQMEKLVKTVKEKIGSFDEMENPSFCRLPDIKWLVGDEEDDDEE